MKLISVLSLILSAHAVPDGDSFSTDDILDKLKYVPSPSVQSYIEQYTSMQADFSKEDHAYIIKSFAHKAVSDYPHLTRWQSRISGYLKDFIEKRGNIQINDVMDLLTKPAIQGLSMLMNFPKGSDIKNSFQSSLDRDVCVTKDFVSKLDATQFNHNFLGTLINALIDQQRRISYPEDHDKGDVTGAYNYQDPYTEEYKKGKDARLECFSSLIKLTSAIVETYSQGDITLDMLLKNDLSGWGISGEEFFKFPDTYGKHMELIYLPTTNTHQETFALNLLRYGSPKLIAKMILLNISLEDIASDLPSYTCHRGFLDKLLLNKNLSSADRHLFLEALLPLFNTMDRNCLWGATWNSLSNLKTFQTDFGFSESQLKEEDEKLMKQINWKNKSSEKLSLELIYAYDRGTTIFGERLGLKKSLSCPVYELEHAYNLGQRNLLEEKQKEDVCLRTVNCIKEHADFPLWSQLGVKYQTAGVTYKELCVPSVLKEIEKKGFLSSTFLDDLFSEKKNELLKKLKDVADEEDMADKSPTRLPDDNFRRRKVVFKYQADKVTLNPFSLPILEDVMCMINESLSFEFVNISVAQQILGSKLFVEYLKSLPKVRQIAMARVIYLKTLEPFRSPNEVVKELFVNALSTVDGHLLEVIEDD